MHNVPRVIGFQQAITIIGQTQQTRAGETNIWVFFRNAHFAVRHWLPTANTNPVIHYLPKNYYARLLKPPHDKGLPFMFKHNLNTNEISRSCKKFSRPERNLT